MKFYKFFIWSNIPIALDATAWTGLTYKILQTSPNLLMCALSFCFTWLFYTLDRIFVRESDWVNNPERTQWYASQTYLKPVMLCVIVLLLIFFSMYSILIIPILIGIVPCLLYTKKIKIFRYSFSLKALTGMKVIMVAFLWIVLTLGLPGIVLKVNWLNPRFIYLSGMITCFIMVQINTNDLRDIKGDTQDGVKSFAVLWGDKKARLFGLVLIGSGIFFAWDLFNYLSLMFFSVFLITRTLLYKKEADIYWQLPISIQGIIAYFVFNF